MSYFLISGLVIGFSSGVMPGPLMTLVITETLKHGVATGLRVAFAPLMTDIPLIFASVFLLSKIQDMSWLLGCISILGACFLLFLAWESFSSKGADLNEEGKMVGSLTKAIVANLLNPAAYLYWVSVGAPFVLKGMDHSLFAGVGFVATFFGSFIAAKILVAVLVGKYRDFLHSHYYLAIMRVMGVALLVFALLFFREGYRQFVA